MKKEAHFSNRRINEEERNRLEHIPERYDYLLTIHRDPTPEGEIPTHYQGGPFDRQEVLSRIEEYVKKYVNGIISIGRCIKSKKQPQGLARLVELLGM